MFYLHGHKSQEISDEGMKSASVEFLLAEAVTSQNALCQEEEHASQQGLVSQSFIYLCELHQSYRQK